MSIHQTIPVIEWIKTVHTLQKQRKSSPVLKRYGSPNPIYKCKWGNYCFHADCPHLHLGQKGYEDAVMVHYPIPCRYETTFTSCRLKCRKQNGQYCPYEHCTHPHEQILSCQRPECKQHCSLCM